MGLTPITPSTFPQAFAQAEIQCEQFLWCFRLPECTTDFTYTWKTRITNVQFLTCVMVWHFRVLNSLNDFPHVLQEHAFSHFYFMYFQSTRLGENTTGRTTFRRISVDYSMGFVQLNKLNDFPHVLQVYGLARMWVISCSFRLYDLVNDFPHVLQVYSFAWVSHHFM